MFLIIPDFLLYAKCFQDVSISEDKCALHIRQVQSVNLDPHNITDFEGN